MCKETTDLTKTKITKKKIGGRAKHAKQAKQKKEALTDEE